MKSLCCILHLVISLNIALCLSNEKIDDFCDPNTEGFCSTVEKQHLTFANANKECQRNNMSLVTIKSKSDQELLLKSLRKVAQPKNIFWIGLYDSLDGFRWASGYTVVSSTYFAPDEFTAHQCVAITVRDGLYTWTSQPCTSKLPFLCGRQFDAPTQSKPSVLKPSVRCPDKYTLVQNSCFLFASLNSSWVDASKACAKKYGQLMQIDSLVKQDYLTVLLSNKKQSVWIGLRSHDNQQQWVSLDRQTPIASFSNWAPGYPMSAKDDKCTRAIGNGELLGMWENTDCNNLLGYICQAPALSHSTDPSVQLSGLFTQKRCEIGFFEYNNRCYQLQLEKSAGDVTSKADESKCKTRIAPHSIDEWAFVRLLLTYPDAHPTAWIGVTAQVTNVGATKLSIQTEDKLSMNSLQAVDFTAFVPSTAHYCFTIWRNSSDLHLTDCTEKHVSVCGGNLVDSTLQRSQSDLKECPHGWSRYETKCLSGHMSESKSWFEAEKACQNLHTDSHLVSNPDAQLTTRLGTEFTWLGLHASFMVSPDHSVRYRWSDGSPVDHFFAPIGKVATTWMGALRDIGGSLEACFTAHATHWQGVSCHDLHPFQCQITLNTKEPGDSIGSSVPIISKCMKEMDPKVCYEFSEDPLSFVGAINQCASKNQTLAVIPSEKHQAFVMNLLRSIKKKNVSLKTHFGLFGIGGNLHWTTPNMPILATFWHEDSQHSEKKCSFLDSAVEGLRTWKSGPCEQQLPYLCSTPMHPPTSVASNQADFFCPNGFTRIGSGCFKISTTSSNWKQTEAACATMATNAHLATIASLEENDGLTVLIDQNVPGVWIGLHLKNNLHIWSQSRQVSFTNWEPNEPNGVGTSCVMLNGPSSSNAGLWADRQCHQTLRYVCQAPPVTASATNEKSVPYENVFQRGKCVKPYYEYQNRCFTLVATDKSRSSIDLHDSISGFCLRSVHMVNYFCSEKRYWGVQSCPVAATPHSLADAAYIRSLINHFGNQSKEAWIGLKVHSVEQQMIVQSEDRSLVHSTEFIDFEEPPYSNGKVSEVYQCLIASVESTKMSIKECSVKDLSVVCSYYLESHPLYPKSIASGADHFCPNGWTLLGGKCYQASAVGVRKTWLDAYSACQQAGVQATQGDVEKYPASLASIHSNKEQVEIGRLLSSSSSWIGLMAVPIGYGRSTGRHSFRLAWLDSSPVDYIAFSSHPYSWIDEMGVQLCTIMFDSHPYWKPIECAQPRGYVCQMEAKRNNSGLIATSASCLDGEFQLSGSNATTCYRVVTAPLDWVSAEQACDHFHSGTHLASLHSRADAEKLSAYLHSHFPDVNSLWFGLFEDALSYSWSDKSSIDFIPVSADLSKRTRFLSQDCFALRSSSAVYRWVAHSCTTEKFAYICQKQLSQTASGKSLTPEKPFPPLKLIDCPPGYKQYSDRCFKLYTAKNMSWFDANQECATIIGKVSNFRGSLARIDSNQLQDFVASLLDGLPSYASAWIGFQRTLSKSEYSMRWSDDGPMSYARPLYISKTIPQDEVNSGIAHVELCTAIFRSTSPLLNGLWFGLSCNEGELFPAVCQATPVQKVVPSPTSSDKHLINPSRSDIYCPEQFQLGTTGLVTHRDSISHAVCYRMLDRNKKLDWEHSKRGCEQLSTSEYDVTLLSLASVFETNFVRSWLRLPAALRGPELSESESVWTGLRVTDDCPQCYVNWTWSTVQQDPVRYTDWLDPPTPPSGCYLFQPNPYRRFKSYVDTGLGSLQPTSQCSSVHFAVCQTAALTSSDGKHQQIGTHQMKRPECYRMRHIEAGHLTEVRTDTAVTISGKPCLRWDLLRTNLTRYKLDYKWLHLFSSSSSIVAGDGLSSYAENYCSELLQSNNEYVYGCYSDTRPETFEPCHLVPCSTNVIQHQSSSHFTAGSVLLMVVVFILISIMVAFAVWKCFIPARVSYSRFQPNSRRNSSRVPIFTAHFGNGPSRGELVFDDHMSNNEVTLLDRSVLSNNPYLFVDNGALSGQPDAQSGTPHSFGKYLGSVGFRNPAYQPLVTTGPDDYDPEAEA